MEQREKAERVKWHPGFYGGIALELKLYRNVLEFEQELNLSNEPLRMDMLIIKKKTAEKVNGYKFTRLLPPPKSSGFPPTKPKGFYL